MMMMVMVIRAGQGSLETLYNQQDRQDDQGPGSMDVLNPVLRVSQLGKPPLDGGTPITSSGKGPLAENARQADNAGVPER